MRCFSSLRSLGDFRIKARLTAPRNLSQSSTPFRLLVPRHPPHALKSLAAPPNRPRPHTGSLRNPARQRTAGLLSKPTINFAHSPVVLLRLVSESRILLPRPPIASHAAKSLQGEPPAAPHDPPN